MGKRTNLRNPASHRFSTFNGKNARPQRKLEHTSDGLEIVADVMCQPAQQFAQGVGSGKFVVKPRLLAVKTPYREHIALPTRLNDRDLRQSERSGVILRKKTIPAGNLFVSGLKIAPG